MKLKAKLLIKGRLKAVTGLSIGGSTTDVIIGGIDNNVIKDSAGVPYIPGSSLKGKLRSLSEMSLKDSDIEDGNVCQCGTCDACLIYGVKAGNNEGKEDLTRLFVRDAYLDSEMRRAMENKKGIFKKLELEYTEGKWENTIDRKTSAANPRQIERVPAGAEFDIDLIYNIFEPKDIDRLQTLISAMRLLEDDYLGGHGSRGYGRVSFTSLNIQLKTIDDYRKNNEPLLISSCTLNELNFTEIKNKIDKKLGMNSNESN